MNKPIAFICACIAAIGFLTLGRCAYCTIVYGHGSLEAGNFLQYDYVTARDPVSGMVYRDWTEKHWVGSTEQPPFADVLNMWLVGLGFLVLGGGIYVAGWSTRGTAHF